MMTRLRHCLTLSSFAAFLVVMTSAPAATFTNNASIRVDDPSSSLTATSGVFTASCWFKISLPSSLSLTTNMVILMDRTDGNESANHSFLIRYNVGNGRVEFVTRGALGTYTRTLIAQPYLERWYHVAVVRNGGVFNIYLDGRAQQPFDDVSIVGNTTGGGLSIGGVGGNSRLFFGEIIEVAVYQRALDQTEVRNSMFSDQRTNALITGYYKLGYSTNVADYYRNYVTNPPSGSATATKLGTGNIDFEQTDQAGEQSLYDSQRNHGADAIAPLSGAFTWGQTAFARPTPGIAFDLSFAYSSATPTSPPGDGSEDPFLKRTLSAGWRHSFDARVVIENNTMDARLVTWGGGVETWTRTNFTMPYSTRHKEYRGDLILDLFSGDIYWTNADRTVYRFHSLYDANLPGRLREICDQNGNRVQVQWNNSQRWVARVRDSAGGEYVFNYDEARQLLTNVTFGQWRVNFTYDSTTNRLIAKSLTNTSGLYTNINTTWQFQYASNGLLARIVDPRGFTNVFVQYDQYGRLTNQVDALNRTNRTRYGVPLKRQITRIDPAGFEWIDTHDRKGRILTQQDPLTNITTYTYDSFGNRTSVTEPLGYRTTFGYDTRANLIAQTNALGLVSRWVIHPFYNKAIQQITPVPEGTNGIASWTNFHHFDSAGNLTNHSDALGSLVSYQYASNGLVLTSTDANGNSTHFAYDTNGFPTARTDAATNTWQFIVNEVGWKLAEFNPFNDVTSFAYDLNGNIVSTVDPLNRVVSRQWDANGNLLAQSDHKNQFTRHTYDAANQRIATTNRLGQVWQFAFTLRGKPERATDPLGHSTTNFYDAANRLVRVSDPVGNSITNQYDANGNSVAMFDPAGQRWTKVYDRLNRVSAETDPLGNARQTTYDVAGRLAQRINPNGYPSLHTYDGRGRLREWRDPEGYLWRYDYDGNGNITNITDALEGHYLMAYGPRNERLLERNQDGFEWQYTYDPVLRLKTERDPNQTLRTRNYDAAGRVTSYTLSTGREDTYTYDDNDNPRAISRRMNGVALAHTSLTYDALDRVTRTVDTHGQAVDYGLDALGRVIRLTYPGNRTLTNRFDALGRLTNQVDWAARQTHYQYDRVGRLIRRVYPNGVAQTNVFDTAGRITGLSHSTLNPQPSTLNLALTYAYDRNGNKVGGGEKGTFTWPLPSLSEETSHFTPSGRITNRVDALNASQNFTYQFDASGNMTNASGAGQTWRLTYDEDNRTTSINWDCLPTTSKLITNRYDALGRRISRKVDSTETRFVLDLSGSMERILCDTDANGNISAWYIHGPDLSYRADASTNVTCYHADAQANIIAITGAAGTNLVQYAYTAYGRSLGSTNCDLSTINSQPFTFVGSQGVMEELHGLYFMRARYYSAEAGVFLSTDPVKKIGPGWKPVAYGYADTAPLSRIDPKGEAYWLAAAAFIGWAHGTIDAEVENITRLAVIDLPQALGLPNKYTKPAADIFFGVKDFMDTVDDGAKLIAGGASPTGVGSAYFAGNQASKITAKYLDPKFIRNSYDAAIYSMGNALGSMLYNRFEVGAQAPLKLATPSAGNSIANKTVTVAAPAAQAPNATSTKGASPSGRSSASSGVVSYTVKPGDTLGNIAYANNTTVSALMSANPQIKNADLIYSGSSINVPSSKNGNFGGFGGGSSGGYGASGRW